jgi:hypothetical protein
VSTYHPNHHPISQATPPVAALPDRACAHCGGPQRGYGRAEGKPLCHPDDGLDCYNLVTMSGHDMPCGTLDADRRYCEAVDDFFGEIEAQQ